VIDRQKAGVPFESGAKNIPSSWDYDDNLIW